MTTSHKLEHQPAITAKRLLAIEVAVCVTAVIVLLALVVFAALVPMTDWQQIILIGIGIAEVLVAMFCAIRIEQIAGFYRCAKCGHTYVPTYGSVFWALHFGRTRYLKCPKCHQRSWQKKTLTKTNS